MVVKIDLPTVAQALILGAPVYLPILVTVLSAAYRYAVSKLPANQRPVIERIVDTAVMAVEQTTSNTLNGTGKKEMAIEIAQAELAHWHIQVPESVLSALIEESVSNNLIHAAPIPDQPTIQYPTHIQ